MIFIYIVLLVIAVLFYILYKGVISFLILLFTALMPVAMLISIIYAARKISFRLSAQSKRCGAGESIPVNIEIENKTIIPIFSCEITLDLILSSAKRPERLKINTPIFPNNAQTLTAAFSSEHYGIAECRIAKVKLFDMLRLFRIKISPKKIKATNNSVTILPDTSVLENPIRDYSELGLDSDSYSSDKAGDDPSEIFSIHEYAEGDKLSRVHWKLTAKEDKLMVKDYSLPLADSFLIIVDSFIDEKDPERSAVIYDTMIELAASVSGLLSQNEIRHKLMSYSEKDKTAVSDSISDDSEFIEAIAKLLSAGICSEPSLAAASLLSTEDSRRKYGHMILISANADRRTIDLLADSGIAYRFTVLVCTDTDSAPINIPLDNNTEIIGVRAGNIESSISEMVF